MMVALRRRRPFADCRAGVVESEGDGEMEADAGSCRSLAATVLVIWRLARRDVGIAGQPLTRRPGVRWLMLA